MVHPSVVALAGLLGCLSLLPVGAHGASATVAVPVGCPAPGESIDGATSSAPLRHAQEELDAICRSMVPKVRGGATPGPVMGSGRQPRRHRHPSCSCGRRSRGASRGAQRRHEPLRDRQWDTDRWVARETGHQASHRHVRPSIGRNRRRCTPRTRRDGDHSGVVRCSTLWSGARECSGSRALRTTSGPRARRAARGRSVSRLARTPNDRDGRAIARDRCSDRESPNGDALSRQVSRATEV